MKIGHAVSKIYSQTDRLITVLRCLVEGRVIALSCRFATVVCACAAVQRYRIGMRGGRTCALFAAEHKDSTEATSTDV